MVKEHEQAIPNTSEGGNKHRNMFTLPRNKKHRIKQ